MGLLSSLWKLIKRIVSKLVAAVKKIIKALWPLILLVAVIWFAPAIGGWFTTSGFPTIGSWFSTIGTTITPTVTGWVSSLWSGAVSLGSKSWTAFKSLELGTQAAIVAGAAAVLAPDETADVLEETGTLIGEVGSALVGGAVSGISPWIWVGGGLLLFFLLSNKRETVVQAVPQQT